MNIFEIKQLIPNSKNWMSAEEIKYGWSGEQKYIITDQKKQKFLLRLLNRNQFESQLPAIKFLQKCGNTINNVPKVYSFGITSDENYAFLLLDYITGENGMKVIQNYNTDDQYLLGYKMGKTLFDIHNLKTYADEYNETCNYKQEVEKYLNYYFKNKDKFPFLTNIENSINNFLPTILNRPKVMLHNDFHLGNMIINNNEIYLIDFNRAKLGDNIKDFDGIAWSATHSVHFATGLLDAYVQNTPNVNEFFQILHGYINIWQIQMLYFIADQDDEEKKTVLDLIKFTSSWFDKNAYIPNWYLQNTRITIK